MLQFNELKNGRDLLDEVYEKFSALPNKKIKKGICDALFLINHFISLNENPSRLGKPSDEMCPFCGANLKETLVSFCGKCGQK